MRSDKMNVELPSHKLTLIIGVYFACKYVFHHVDIDADAQPFSPAPILYEEEADEAVEAGSFSPELLNGDAK